MAWFCTQRCISPQLQQYRESELDLRLLLQAREVLFSIQADDARVLCTGAYVYQGEKESELTGDVFAARLSELSRAEVLLNPDWKYHSVEYTVSEESGLLMPIEYELTPNAAALLRTLYPPVVNEEVAVELFKHKHLHGHIVSGFQDLYTAAVQSLYPKAVHRSVYSRLAERFLVAEDLPKRFPNHILLCLRPPYFDLWIRNPEGLLLANRYPYHSYENLLYYLLYAINKHQLDAGNTFLLACGAVRAERIGERLDNHIGAWAYPTFESHTLCLPPTFKV